LVTPPPDEHVEAPNVRVQLKCPQPLTHKLVTMSPITASARILTVMNRLHFQCSPEPASLFHWL
jgi:hypothetical protein